MNTRDKILLSLALAILGIGLGYFFDNSYNAGLCFRDLATHTYDISCERLYEPIGRILFPVSIALSVSLLALSFVPKAVLAWGRFTFFSVLIGFFLIATTPQSNTGGLSGVVGFGPTRDDITFWVSVLFALGSLIIIFRTWWKGQKNP